MTVRSKLHYCEIKSIFQAMLAAEGNQVTCRPMQSPKLNIILKLSDSFPSCPSLTQSTRE